VLRERTLDQSNRQAEHLTEFLFFARHLTIIALVVKTRQMKNSVQRENLHFLGRRVSEAQSILQGNLGGDGDLAYKRRPLGGSRLRRGDGKG